jgi:hypothetical protein
VRGGQENQQVIIVIYQKQLVLLVYTRKLTGYDCDLSEAACFIGVQYTRQFCITDNRCLVPVPISSAGHQCGIPVACPFATTFAEQRLFFFLSLFQSVSSLSFLSLCMYR